MINYRGKWALVTGASSGIGEYFCRELAKRGANLIMVARRKEKLTILAEQLTEHYKIQVHVISLDLSLVEAAQYLYDEVQKLSCHVDVLINNAGFGVYGKLHETSVKRNQEMLTVNVYSLALLTQLFLPAMVQKKEGVIINVASTAAFQPVPYMSNYGATKAFVLSFTEALWAEYKNHGIHILAVCPGPVETEFFDMLDMGEPSLGTMDTPENVVESAFNAIDKNKIYIIPGPAKNYIKAQLNRFSPRAITAKVAEKILRRKD
jgi:short-subunit dehydrogenase